MTAAFGILALLIGEVALPGINSPDGLTSPHSARTTVGDLSGPGYMPGRSQRSSGVGGQSPRGMQPQIPYAPTDPDAGQAVYPWGSPTSQLNPAAGGGGSGSRNSLLDYPSLWRTPTTPRGGPQRNTMAPMQPFGSSSLGNPRAAQDFFGYSPYSGQRAGGAGADYRRAPATIGGGVGGISAKKPYSSYRRGSAVSPYMNLFRDNDDFGRVDNYSTLVQPRLDQRSANRRAAGQIRGLQNSSRNQGSAIRNIGSRTGTVPRTTGQFFNNTQQYYPGSGR